jgi:hypothetical protein
VTLPFWIHHHVDARRVAEVYDVGERINMVTPGSILATSKLSMSLSWTRSQGRTPPRRTKVTFVDNIANRVDFDHRNHTVLPTGSLPLPNASN